MKNKKYYILIVSVFVIMSFLVPAFVSAQVKTSHSKKVLKINKNLSEKQNTKHDNISIDVEGLIYKVDVPKNSTVYDAMKILGENKESNFSFHAKEYPSLGNFVDEINKVKGKPGRYWIYYINNKKASVGVSKYVLASGDLISWKQEGF